MIVKRINKEDLLNQEKEFRELFLEYIIHSKDNYFHAVDMIHDYILACLMDDQFMVLAAIENGRPEGYMVCGIREREINGIRECVVWQLLSMFTNKEVAQTVMNMVEDWARENNCDLIRANSYRKGMETYLKKYGFSYAMAVFEKKLKKERE